MAKYVFGASMRGQAAARDDIVLLTHQAEFAFDTHAYTALSGGLGSGKSYAIGARLWYLAQQNAGYPGMLITRSGSQMFDLQGQVNKALCDFGFENVSWADFKDDPQPGTFTLYDGRIYVICWRPGLYSEVYCHTAENKSYTRWAGGNRAFGILDEFDTMQDQEQVWRHMNDRIRIGPYNNASVASSPEGYRQMWKFFEHDVLKEPSLKAQRRLIKACTLDNPFINLDYIERQINTRDPKALRAYIYGEFVNLEGHLVFWRFDQDKSATNRTLQSFDTDTICHVGVDFNKNINAASVTCFEGGRPYTVYEFHGASDTAALIDQIDDALAGRPVRIYPDATNWEGRQQLNRRYGESNVIFTPGNPSVGQSVDNANTNLFINGAHWALVNPETCPGMFASLMQQTKNDRGEPDKTKGLDHFSDGYRYMLWHASNIDPMSGSATVLAGY